jgi:hypothetical protein
MRKSYQYGDLSLAGVSGAFARADDSGMYRVSGLAPGSYYVRASRDGYDTSLYPNASALTSAQSVEIKAGETRDDIDFRLQSGRRFTLEGQLIDGETGHPATAAFLRAISADLVTGTFVDDNVHDGHFQLEGMKPGRYYLKFSWVGPTNNVIRTVVFPFDMGAADQTGVILTALPRVIISGKITGTGGRLPPNLTVTIGSTEPALLEAGAGSTIGSSDLQPDGTFKIDRVEAGRHQIGVHSGNPPQFYVRERDPILVAGNNISGVEIELDFSAGAITGRAVDSAGTPLPYASVVLQSTDPRKRAASLYGYVYGAGVGGQYFITGVVPGEYLLFSWRGYHGLIGDPDLFAEASKYAKRVTITPRSVLNLDASELIE